jgi:uncharacterized protein (DUF302 family)
MYNIKKTTTYDFQKAIEKTKEALGEEGFGILNFLDVKKIMKEKLDLDYDEYMILGVCNPDSAHQALEAEKDIGLMLPCNVIVYRDGGSVKVAAINPTETMKIVDNPEITAIAEGIENKLRKAIESI